MEKIEPHKDKPGQYTFEVLRPKTEGIGNTWVDLSAEKWYFNIIDPEGKRIMQTPKPLPHSEAIQTAHRFSGIFGVENERIVVDGVQYNSWSELINTRKRCLK